MRHTTRFNIALAVLVMCLMFMGGWVYQSILNHATQRWVVLHEIQQGSNDHEDTSKVIRQVYP